MRCGLSILLRNTSQKYEFSITFLWSHMGLIAQLVKNLPSIQETRVQALGQEDPLEKEMATPLQYSCLEDSLDREEPGGLYSPWGGKESDMTVQLIFTFRFVIAFLPRSKCLLISWLQSLSAVAVSLLWSPGKYILSLFQLFPLLFAMK